MCVIRQVRDTRLEKFSPASQVFAVQCLAHAACVCFIEQFTVPVWLPQGRKAVLMVSEVTMQSQTL